MRIIIRVLSGRVIMDSTKSIRVLNTSGEIYPSQLPGCSTNEQITPMINVGNICHLSNIIVLLG